MFAQIINSLSDLLYTYVLIVLLLGTGIYFTVKNPFCPVPFPAGSYTRCYGA